MIEVLPAHKNTKFQNFIIVVQVLNTTAIASGYTGRDPQDSFDAIRLTWIVIGTKRRKVERRKKKNTKNKELTNVTIDSIF